MTDVHQCSRVDFMFLHLCFQNDLLFCCSPCSIATLATFRAFVHCCFPIRKFHRLRHRNKGFAFFQPFLSSKYKDGKRPSCRCTEKAFPIRNFFPSWLEHRCLYKFRSRGTTGSSMLDHDLGHLCRGGHSEFGSFSTLGASSIFDLGVSWYCDARFASGIKRSLRNLYQ